MKKFKVLFIALFVVSSALSQRIKTDDIEYRYIKLPTNPIASSIKNFQSSIFASYEAENANLMAKYEQEKQLAEQEYQQAMADHPAKVKAAEDKYTQEMAAWKEKSMAEKILEKQLLNENNKPVKNIPYPPYKRNVSMPKLKGTYDYAALASTYIKLDGFENNQDNAVKIIVTLNGFEYSTPRQVTEQKSVVSSANGTTTTSQVNYYHVEFTYRHTMSVKAIGADGKELFYLTPQELNSYKTYKSAESKTAVSYNEEALAKTYEEKILQENLTLISNLVNDRIGFKREPRKTGIDYIKSKDETYADLLMAYNEASSGLNSLADDEAGAKVKLTHAIEIWNTALQESDITNRKARIDKDVTISIYFNLLEGYFATRDLEGFEKIMGNLNTMSISNGERRKKEQYDLLFIDLKKRMQANK